jgi:hypothetical protein
MKSKECAEICAEILSYLDQSGDEALEIYSDCIDSLIHIVSAGQGPGLLRALARGDIITSVVDGELCFQANPKRRLS